MDLSGKRAIELGCGVGLPSVVALERGACEVVATDHYKGALDFAAHNAKENIGRGIGTALLDWRFPELDGLGTFDLMLAADVMYERVNARYLAGLAPRLMRNDGRMLLADPRRPGASLFIEEMKKSGFRAFRTEVVVEQDEREVPVLVHEIRR